MSLEHLISTIWRRKLVFLATLVLCLGATVALTLALPKRYSGTVTMFVGERREDSQSLLIDTGAGEQLARTYTTLASNPNVAEAVRGRLTGFATAEDLLDEMSFAPIERTQLLEITATAASPEAARRTANVYGATFVSLVSDQFSRGLVPTRIALSQPAPLPTSPSSPNVPLFIGIGALLCLMLAGVAALLRDRLDDRLRVDAEAERIFDHPILLRLPDLGGLGAGSRAVVGDTVRLLRTNIDFVSQGAGHVVAVTSPDPVQGKSTTASLMAQTAAVDGERTLLIEADLRRPGLGRTSVGPVPAHRPVGLSNYLAGMATVDEVVEEHPEHSGLSVIWSGPLPPNPAVLLSSDRLAVLLEALRPRFDRIIIDTPPLSIGPDASVTVARADGTLLVVDARDVRVSKVRAALTQLERSNANVLGIVLNHALTRRDLSRYSYATDYAEAPVGKPAPQAASTQS